MFIDFDLVGSSEGSDETLIIIYRKLVRDMESVLECLACRSISIILAFLCVVAEMGDQ